MLVTHPGKCSIKKPKERKNLTHLLCNLSLYFNQLSLIKVLTLVFLKKAECINPNIKFSAWANKSLHQTTKTKHYINMALRGIPNFRTKEKRVLLFKQVGPVGRKSLTFLYTLKIRLFVPKKPKHNINYNPS